ncbi:MAG: HD domain-containing protein [Spirochaetaceae bacterium]|nr:HD domain-containing protein [Spirochaetaceae bacterium]
MLLSLFGCNSNNKEQYIPLAQKGILDLRNLDLDELSTVKLQGEWEFYWKQFLYPEDFKNPLTDPSAYAAIPGRWNGYRINDETLKGNGYATYRLTVKLNESHKDLALKILTIQTSYRVFTDGDLIASGGNPGINEKASKPGYKPQLIHFKPTSDTIEIIFHVSNFNHRHGGMWGVPSLGTSINMDEIEKKARGNVFFIIGAILVIGIYYLGLFLIHKQEREALYFALYCLFISLRIFVTGDIYLLEYLPDLPWKVLTITEYITFFYSIPFFMLFIYSMFKSSFLKKLTTAVLLLSSLFSLFTFVAPVRFSSHLIPLYQIITLVGGLYILIILVIYSFQKNTLAKIILAGFLSMFITVINDILYAADIINSIYMISYGILLFIIFQSLAMTIRFAKSFNEVERQKRQLVKTNMEYRHEIEETARLQEDLQISYQRNAMAKLAIIMGLAKLAEYRDSDTGSHIERIQEFNTALAKQLQKHEDYIDYISDEYIEDLHVSSILHDIGKVGIPDSILLKPGKLTTEEFEIMKEHSMIGGDSIKMVEQKTGVRSFLTLARDIAYMHHERWDGNGYPFALKGDEIPLSARLTALVDVYDALTSERCYKEAFSHEKAVSIILESRGTHFDPDIVDAFMQIENEFDQIRKKLLDDSTYSKM